VQRDCLLHRSIHGLETFASLKCRAPALTGCSGVVGRHIVKLLNGAQHDHPDKGKQIGEISTTISKEATVIRRAPDYSRRHADHRTAGPGIRTVRPASDRRS
jgi:hypothetical protein